jgi:hypothetical protein
MPETICPNCGFSPIPRDAEECPVCHQTFAFVPRYKRGPQGRLDPKRAEVESEEATTFGGAITGAVTAHPYPTAGAFITGAVIWFLRGSGLLADLNEPGWVFGAAIADLIIPLMIIINIGPAKLAAQFVAGAQVLMALFLGRHDLSNPVHILYAAHGVALLVMVVGEPELFRRTLSLSMAGAVAAAAVAVLGLVGMRTAASELGGQQQGYRLSLPPGYIAMTRDEIRPAMRLPPGKAIPFGDPSARVFGMISIGEDSATPLIGGCEALHEAIGGTDEVKPLARPAPPGMGSATLVYGLRTTSGGVGRLACAKRTDGKLVGFAVVLLGADPSVSEGVSEQAFDALGAGFTVL